MGSRQQRWSLVTIVVGLELRWGNHADLSVRSPMIEPINILEGGVFDVVEPAPGPVLADLLRLVEPVGVHLPVTKDLSARMLSLPFHPQLAAGEFDDTVSNLADVMAS